jgi:hypothetical protein
LIQPALYGGLFIGILSALPIVSIANYCCCAWVLGGGVLASYLLQQGKPASLTPRRGALVGLAAGVTGAVVWLVASMALDVVLAPLQARLVTEVLRTAGDMPSEVRQWLEAMASGENAPFRYALGFLFHLVAGALFATVGGVIGAAYFRKDVPPALGGPVT